MVMFKYYPSIFLAWTASWNPGMARSALCIFLLSEKETVFFHLLLLDTAHLPFKFRLGPPIIPTAFCLLLLLFFCSCTDPSWMEERYLLLPKRLRGQTAMEAEKNNSENKQNTPYFWQQVGSSPSVTPELSSSSGSGHWFL